MAANKFATMVHKNTNKITLVLIYAVLEWILIILLLLNSIFSYLIIKFANFFGLKPPCLWCIRLECFFEPQNKNSHTDLLCELHAKEVSQLGFCSNHRKLAESHDMCDDCSSGIRVKSRDFLKVKQSDLEDEGCVKCSCCGVEFERKSFDDSSYFVINPSWDFLGFSKNGSSIMDLIGSDLENDNFGEKQEIYLQKKETEETEVESVKEDLIQFEKREDSNSETPVKDLEFFLDYSGQQLVPIESMDDTRDELRNNSEVDEDHEFGDFQKAQVMMESKVERVFQELVKETEETVSVVQDSGELASVIEKTEESSKLVENDSMVLEENEKSIVFHANISDLPDEKTSISEPSQSPLDTEELQETEENDSEHEEKEEKEEKEVENEVEKELEKEDEEDEKEEEEEVSIGTEIPVLDSCDDMKAQDNFTLYYSSHEEPSTSSHDLDFNLEYGFDEAREEEKLWELTKTTESVSELDNGDPINTTEKLKSALRAERKALQALYTELEEERSASAVAASETMAMINRLQEEKAAMQMEALQYQRMMEEQSEYDQEALQLLNDLMMKKEKELESCRKKMAEYEAKERMRFLASSVKSGTCSASCSHSEDGDGMWVDVNSDSKEEGNANGNHERKNRKTPVETVLDLDSFVDFEDERLSILEQLKVLEEKLVTLSDEEDRHFNDISQIEDYFEENGKHFNGNGITNIFPTELHYQDRRSDGLTGKRLLPLFDALDTESEDGVIASNGHENGFHSDKLENTAVTRFELQKKRIDIEEEVDQLYIRLQALEADREFLKHCLGSLKKGDKGMELLQEILQHLRDLKSMDLRAKNFTD